MNQKQDSCPTHTFASNVLIDVKQFKAAFDL